MIQLKIAKDFRLGRRSEQLLMYNNQQPNSLQPIWLWKSFMAGSGTPAASGAVPGPGLSPGPSLSVAPSLVPPFQYTGNMKLSSPSLTSGHSYNRFGMPVYNYLLNYSPKVKSSGQKSWRDSVFINDSRSECHSICTKFSIYCYLFDLCKRILLT